MLDRQILKQAKQPLQWIAQKLLTAGLKPNQVTVAGFLVGISAVPLIVAGFPLWALLSIALNRLADGVDGTMARLSQPKDLGAFLDIVFDFLFYSSVPLAFAFANPEHNALAATVLIYSFIGTGCSFLAFAVIAAKRGLSSTAYPEKGFYYLGGLTEATETIGVFVLMILQPDWFAYLAYGFASLCLLTTGMRIAAGIELFSEKT